MKKVETEEAYQIISDYLFNVKLGYIPPISIYGLTYEASKQLEDDGYKLLFIGYMGFTLWLYHLFWK